MVTARESQFDKGALVAALAEEWERLGAMCADLDASAWDLETECPGWTVKDIVAHIIGTELSMSGQEVPDVELSRTEHIKNPMGEANEKWIEVRRGSSGAAVLDEFRDVTRARIETLGAMTQADFDAPSWTPAGESVFGRMIRIRLFDSWMHDQDIRAATARPGNLDGPHVDLAMVEIVDSMGYVIGKLGGAPEGSRVQIDLTGPTTQTIQVEVDGRARVVESLSDEPTVVITMPTLLFVRLCGGRRTADDALAAGDIQIAGDSEAGHRIVTHLAYMI